MKRKLIDYLPLVLRPYREMLGITDGQQWLFNLLWDAIDRVFDNQFLESCDEYGISRWEGMLQITPKGTDNLEERRFRILAKLREQLPFTYRMLLQQLTVLCGEGNFTVSLLPYAYLLKVSVRLKNRKNIEAVRELLERMVPVNMIFTAEPAYNPWEYTNGMRWMDLRPYLWVQVREEEFRNG